MRRNANVRTYGQLIASRPPTTGNCCACHEYSVPVWQLGIRASICEPCALKKKDEVLGSIQRSERRARSWIKSHPNTWDQPKWLSHLTGASIEFIEAEIAKVREKAE